MCRQKGFIAPFYLYAIVLLLILSALAGLYWKVHHDGFEQGKAETLNLWSAENRKAEEVESAARKIRDLESSKAAAAIASASNKARDFESRWRALRAANPVLAQVECGANVAVVPIAVGDGSDGLRLLLTTDFLRFYDTVWTDQDGKPIFGDTGVVTGAPVATVTIDALLDTHAENASRCSQNSRQLNSLIDLLTILRK